MYNMNINLNFGYQPRGCRGGGWRPSPVYRPVNTNHGNLDGATVGRRHWFFGGGQAVKGYGVDLNNDGRYTRGTDGVLAFDTNRNGKLDRKEITRTREMMRAFGGSNDINGDGKVSFSEKQKARRYRARMQKLDLNRDGKLSTFELARGGAKVGVDHNRNGHIGRHETYSPYNIPTPGFGRGRLNFVDPARGYSQVNHGWQWSYPPCYCGR